MLGNKQVTFGLAPEDQRDPEPDGVAAYYRHIAEHHHPDDDPLFAGAETIELTQVFEPGLPGQVRRPIAPGARALRSLLSPETAYAYPETGARKKD